MLRKTLCLCSEALLTQVPGSILKKEGTCMVHSQRVETRSAGLLRLQNVTAAAQPEVGNSWVEWFLWEVLDQELFLHQGFLCQVPPTKCVAKHHQKLKDKSSTAKTLVYHIMARKKKCFKIGTFWCQWVGRWEKTYSKGQNRKQTNG